MSVRDKATNEAILERKVIMSNKKIESWDWDIRVRERNLKQARLTPKDVEKHLASLPDLLETTEAVAYTQPALGGRED
jgi:hypothetical protein